MKQKSGQTGPQDLLDSTELLTVLVDSLTEGVAVVDAEGRILRMNQALTQLLGGDASKGRPVSCCDVFHHHRAAPDSCPVRQFPIGRKGMFELFFPDYRCYEERVSPLEMGGKRVAFLLSLTDVTSRELAEQERKHLFLQVEESTRRVRMAQEATGLVRRELLREEKMATVGRVAGMVFGELRRSAAQVEQGLRMLQRDEFRGSPETFQGILAELIRTASRASHILEKLGQLDLSGGDQLAMIPWNSMVGDVVAGLSGLAQERGVTLEFRSGAPVDVEGNLPQLQAVLSGLILNALDARPRTEDRVVVFTGRDRFGGFVVVEDKGPGIPEDQLKQVFAPFFTTATDERRVGLGLTLCQAIIQAHHGELEVTTEADTGTRVRVRVPAAPDSSVSD